MMNNMNIMQPTATFESDSILSRMSNALLQHDQRCEELTLLFDRATKQDLQTIFPILVDNILGPHGTFHWSLRKIHADTNNTEFCNILNFLKPQGPMFKLIYTLLQDVTIKYEFSLAFLPSKVRQMLEGSNINPFYNEILQFTNHQSGRQLVSLLLNPFDYYIFHFVYHLINPCHQRVQNEENWNTVYYNLCAEYLLHFFPTILNSPILPVINFYHGKNPIQSTQHVFKPYKQSSLLKPNLFGDPQVNDMKVMHQHIEKHPRNEIWRSESILMAIIDFWLSNDQVCSQYNNLGGSYPELPSGDYIRIIRVVVKHLHAFASTAKDDNSSLGELKKHTLPMMQARMYVFLRNLLHRWPLDESFRLVLELWLSFVQPWRYAHDSYNRGGGIYKLVPASAPLTDETVKIADERIYIQFIAENLLVYIVILQQLLPRFARIDLASPKNAQMLFRLTKVFNQPNLVNMLKKVESLVENKNYSPTHHSTLNYSSILPPLSPTTRWSRNTTTEIYSSTHMVQDISADNIHPANFFGSNYETFASKYMNLVRQKIYELEGPNFCYKPMFTSPIATEVYELLKLTKTSEIKAVTLLEECKKTQKSDAGVWNLLFGAPPDRDEISLQDRQKAPLFLKSSAEFLIEMFQIKDFHNFDVTPEKVHELSKDDSHLYDNSYATILTPSRVKERLKNMKYEGDPDLIPIRSYEIAFLVRLFYVLATNINQQYGQQMSRWYYNNGFQGRFVANFLQEPMQAYKFEKAHGTSRRVMYHLPPRVSFRKFANKSLLGFLLLGTLFAILVNYGWPTFVLGYFVVYMLAALLRAVFKARIVPTLDLNFNDSLDE